MPCICFCCILLIHITTSSPSLLIWLLGLVWTAGAEAKVCSRLNLLEKRELWRRSRDLPLTFSPTLSLYTKQHLAQWHTKHHKCQKSYWCFSLFHLCLSVIFLEFWEHWFLRVQMQHVELIKLASVQAQTQFKQFRCED